MGNTDKCLEISILTLLFTSQVVLQTAIVVLLFFPAVDENITLLLAGLMVLFLILVFIL